MGLPANSPPPTLNPHAWCPRRAGDSRAPCPALNALANHGLLPHDGKNITLPTMTRAIRETYHLTWPLAIVLAVGGYLMLKAFWRIDLESLALHNAVEHNASLAHADAPRSTKPTFAPTTVDIALLDQLMDDSSDGKVLTAADIARARVRREAAYEPGALDTLHKDIARGEFALVLALFGAGKAVPIGPLRIWIHEERLPDGWVKPEKRIGIFQVIKLSEQIRKLMKTLKAE